MPFVRCISLRTDAMLLVASLVMTGAFTTLSGCRDERTAKRPRQFFPDMDDQPKYKPQSGSDFFADGRSMRQPVAGVVAFGRRAELEFGAADTEQAQSSHEIALARMDLLREDDRVYRGVEPDGDYVEEAPIHALQGIDEEEPLDPAITRRMIERGRERFNIFCIVCHDAVGTGKGMVGQRWSYPLPNFHDAVYQPGAPKGQDGYIFNVIRNGVANMPGMQPPLRMPAYASQINERDAWSIVLYVRSLQASMQGSIDDVPDAKRADLLAHRPASPPKPAPQPAGPVAARVTMTDMLVYEPATVTIKVGETVEWINGSFVVHTVTADKKEANFPKSVLLPDGADPFDSNNVLPDATYRHIFTVPGTYRYFCKPHESTGMIGEVIVEPAG